MCVPFGQFLFPNIRQQLDYLNCLGHASAILPIFSTAHPNVLAMEPILFKDAWPSL